MNSHVSTTFDRNEPGLRVGSDVDAVVVDVGGGSELKAARGSRRAKLSLGMFPAPRKFKRRKFLDMMTERLYLRVR